MDYLIRNFPEDLRAALQHLAIDHKLSLPKLIIEALREYVERESK